MKLVILLLMSFHHFALGQEVANQEYHGCDEGGWSCQYVDNKLRINFTCTPDNNYVRFSLFNSQSFPSETDVLTAIDCVIFEIDFGCSDWSNLCDLREFRAINVTHVRFFQFHSSNNFADYYFENVRGITFKDNINGYNSYVGSCKNKLNKHVSLTVTNSHIKTLYTYPLNVNTLMMKNVVIDTINAEGISANENITISETTFPNLPENGIHISGENVYFVNNTFKRITMYGFRVSSHVFEFSHNYVEKISCRGLHVQAQHIIINNNIFNHLESRALQNITNLQSFASVGSLTFNFSYNLIKNMKPKSLEMGLHPCVEKTIENNSIDCSCRNIFWITSVLVNGVGSVTNDHQFHVSYLTGGEYNCIGHEDSPLEAAASAIQQVCTKSTNSSEHQSWIAVISVILILAIISSIVYMWWRKKNNNLMESIIRNWCFK